MNKQKKQVVVIHGGEAWNTYEEYMTYLKNMEYNPYIVWPDGWKKTLDEKLGSGFEILALQMPSKFNAKYDEWALWFDKLIPYLRNDVIIVGHSLGANFVAKYLACNDLPIMIAQVHLVAGCYGVAGGFDLPSSLERIEKNVQKTFIYHSHDDDVVDFADAVKYKRSLPQATLVELADRGHFLQEEFPELVENIAKNLV